MSKIDLTNFTNFVDGQKLKASFLINDRSVISRAIDDNQIQIYKTLFGDSTTKVYTTKNDLNVIASNLNEEDYAVVLFDESNNNYSTLYQVKNSLLGIVYSDFSLKNIFDVIENTYSDIEVEALLDDLKNELSIDINELQELLSLNLISIEKDITILVSDWVGNNAVIAIDEVTSTNAIIVSINGTEANKTAWHQFGVYASSQEAGLLTFTCETTPNIDIDVELLVGGVPAILNDTYFEGLTTDNLDEGNTNKYFSQVLVSLNDDVIANTAKIGFTQTLVDANEQVILNTAKEGFSQEKVSLNEDVIANLAKNSYPAEDAAIVATLVDDLSKKADLIAGVVPLSQLPPLGGGTAEIPLSSEEPSNPETGNYWFDPQ